MYLVKGGHVLRAAALVAVLCFAHAPIAAATPMFSHVVTSDCNGGVHFMSGSPLETNMNVRSLQRVYNAVVDSLVSRAQCAWYGVWSRLICITLIQPRVQPRA